MRAIIFAAAMLAAALPCEAATLRPLTVLSAPNVRLSDLFDDAGPNAARVLGPAPALGGRVIVESAQLAAIARQFGVSWRPVSLAERIVLDRPGRPLPREDVLEALRAALLRAGASKQSDVELPGFETPLVPLDGAAQPVVTQVDYDAASGRFAALLTITAEAMEPVNLRVAGKVQETMEVVVPASRLPAGTVLRPQDLRIARVRAGLVRGDVARGPAEAAGLALRRPAMAGQPILLADLMREPVVERGAVVMMLLETQGITVAGQGQALEAGAVGEQVRVLNTVSRAVLEAEVTGPGKVRVQPDSTPITLPGHASLAALR